jgi:hypothetical protein
VRRIFVLLVIALVLAGCGASPQSSQQAVDQAFATIGAGLGATAVSTVVPLTALDLESLLIQPGDLPAGVVGSQVKDKAPPVFKDVPLPVKAIDQRFGLADGAIIGGVTVLLYDSPTDLEKAYAVVIKGMGSSAYPSTEVGDKARIGGLTARTQRIAEVSFVRCHALVSVSLSETPQPDDDTLTYAKRLDRRLTPLVCH